MTRDFQEREVAATQSKQLAETRRQSKESEQRRHVEEIASLQSQLQESRDEVEKQKSLYAEWTLREQFQTKVIVCVCDATPRCVAKWLTRLKNGLWPGGTVTCDSVVFVACDQWQAVWPVFDLR